MVRSPRADLRVVSAYLVAEPSTGASCHQGRCLGLTGSGLRSKRSGSDERGAPLPRTGAPLSASAAPGSWVLPAQTQAFDQCAVTLHVLLLQIAQQPTTAADELQQTTLGVEVVPVLLHVLGQIVDAPLEQRDLHFGRPRVAIAGGVVADDLLLDGVVERHAF